METSNDTEVHNLKLDIADMKQEISALKKLSKPLLSRKKAYLSANNSPTNSKQSSAHWSWSDPMDAGAGPGSYNISTDLGKPSQLSSLSYSPRACIPRSFAETALSLLGSHSPPVNLYKPSSKLVQHADPVISFSQASFSRLPYLLEMERRSPGPVYLEPPQRQTGGHISSSKRDTFSHFIMNKNPSPQHYTTEVPSKKPNGRFNKSRKDDRMKTYIPGVERFLKGKEGNFPGYPAQMTSGKKASLMKASGHQTLLRESIKIPGVGSYSVDLQQTQKGHFTFSKAQKKFDIKQRKSYSVGISHDLIRN